MLIYRFIREQPINFKVKMVCVNDLRKLISWRFEVFPPLAKIILFVTAINKFSLK